MADAYPTAPGRRGRQVLVVEDDLATQMLVAEAAREAGFGGEVRAVRTAADALALLRGWSGESGATPSLVLLDMHLPDGNGLDLMRTVRADPSLRAIPIVVFSGSADPRDVARAYEAGANGYVPKPLRFVELAAVLRCTLSYWVDVNVSAGPSGRP